MFFKSKKNKIFFIAEIGSNHEGNFKTAKKLTYEAIHSGADAIKFQIFNAETLVNKKIDKDRYEHGNALHVEGVSAGSTSFKLVLMHDGHADYTAPNNVPVTVN